MWEAFLSRLRRESCQFHCCIGSVSIWPTLIDSVRDKFGLADSIFGHSEFRRTRSVVQLHKLPRTQQRRSNVAAKKDCVLPFFCL